MNSSCGVTEPGRATQRPRRPDDGGSILTVPLNGQEKQDIQFAELPKYDSEGYEYIYVVREYLTGEHAGDYTQVFGAVGEDGGVTDIIWRWTRIPVR